MTVDITAPATDKPHPPAVLWSRRFEDGVINLVVLSMALLPVGEVLSRNLRGQGIPNSATVVQNLTLWVGFLGALLCTREHRHLSLSTSELLPHGPLRAIAHFFSTSVAAVVTACLAYAAFRLVQADSGGDQLLFGKIPQWASEVVMPVALFFMAIRLALSASNRWPGRIACLALVLPILLFPLLTHFSPSASKSILDGLDAHNDSLTWPLGIMVFLALLAGAPIYVAMSGLAMILFFSESTPIASVPTETLRLVISPTLPAIPLLTAAGYVLAEGGSATRLVALYRAWFGWLPGGLAVMTCLICAVFTTLTGGSGVTILALGGLVYPILLQEKYPEGFSLGLVTASGSLGLLFFPSLPVILYGVVAQVPDLNQLYIAGLVPGILMITLVCIYGVSTGVKAKAPKTPFVMASAVKAFKGAKWELLIPLVLLVPFLARLATLVECAALTCTYAIVVQAFITGDIPPAKLPGTLARAATLVGSVLIVLGVALGLTSYLVDAEIPALVITWVRAHIHSQVAFLLTLNAMLLVLGSVLEIYSAIVILAPLVAPLGVSYGVDPIHLAIVFLANLELGFLFPPVGLNLFLSSTRFNKPLPQLYRNAFPFLCIMSASVLLITYVPAMTTGVLHLVYAKP